MWSSTGSTGVLSFMDSRKGPEVYRHFIRAGGLDTFRIRIKQTDMLVSGLGDIRSTAESLVQEYRRQIEDYIEDHPLFAKSLVPVDWDPSAPRIVKDMITAGARAGVGPMASVAGAIAEHVGLGLLRLSPEVVVENGGDVFMRCDSRREAFLMAENSELGGLRIGFERSAEPLGVCTFSGKLGHSVSFGLADAVMTVAGSAAIADAAATAIGNMIRSSRDIPFAIERARKIGMDGVIIIADGSVGIWGKVEILG